MCRQQVIVDVPYAMVVWKQTFSDHNSDSYSVIQLCLQRRLAALVCLKIAGTFFLCLKNQVSFLFYSCLSFMTPINKFSIEVQAIFIECWMLQGADRPQASLSSWMTGLSRLQMQQTALQAPHQGPARWKILKSSSSCLL